MKKILFTLMGLLMCPAWALANVHYSNASTLSPLDSSFYLVNETRNTYYVTNISEYDTHQNQTIYEDMTLGPVHKGRDAIEFDFKWPNSIYGCFEVDDVYGNAFIPYGCYSSGEIDITYNATTQQPVVHINAKRVL